MTDFANLDDTVYGMANTGTAGGRPVYYIPVFTTAANFWYSTWQPVKFGAGGAGAIPTTQRLCTDATQGRLGTFTNASGGATLRLLGWHHATMASAIDILFDRIKDMGGLALNLNTLQTTNLPINLVDAAAAGRCASDGSDVEWWFEVFAAGGATSVVSITVKYTNQGGTANRTATVVGSLVGASMFPIYRMHPIMPYLQAGDTAIKSIESIQLNTSSGTAGNLGIVALKRLATHWSASSSGTPLDWSATAAPVIPNDACPFLMAYATNTGTIKTGHMIIGGA